MSASWARSPPRPTCRRSAGLETELVAYDFCPPTVSCSTTSSCHDSAHRFRHSIRDSTRGRARTRETRRVVVGGSAVAVATYLLLDRRARQLHEANESPKGEWGDGCGTDPGEHLG